MPANAGYAVVYITNHILEFSELADLVSREQLCLTLPVVQINKGFEKHERASFTSDSNHFHLHSEMERDHRKTIKETIETIEPSHLENDIPIFIDILKKYEKTTDIRGDIRGSTVALTLKNLKELYLRLYPRHRQDRHIPSMEEWIKSAEVGVVNWFLRKYLNLYWFRFRKG